MSKLHAKITNERGAIVSKGGNKVLKLALGYKNHHFGTLFFQENPETELLELRFSNEVIADSVVYAIPLTKGNKQDRECLHGVKGCVIVHSQQGKTPQSECQTKDTNGNSCFDCENGGVCNETED